MTTDVLQNYLTVNEEITKTLKYIDKKERKINLIAVSKTVETERILPLITHGHRIFGENRVQEARDKWIPLKEKYTNIELHLIGPLQKNKVKDAVRIFDVIETVASVSLATEIKKECEKQNKKDIVFFAQINTGEEPQKSGLKPDELASFLKECPLPISGLMCIPPVNEEPSVHFHMLATLAKKHNIEHLSMGMSSDFCEGIMLGADYIRVGSKIFGERNK